jgi:hypothetical protein
MIEALQLELQPLNRGRPTKFTPERIQQVRNLVERGKSRDEIAEIIGVTTGSLQVTCATAVARLQECLADSIRATAGKYGARMRNGAPACLRGHSNRQGWSAVARGLP